MAQEGSKHDCAIKATLLQVNPTADNTALTSLVCSTVNVYAHQSFAEIVYSNCKIISSCSVK